MTPKQRKVLDAVLALTDRGVTPTYREVAKESGFALGGVFDTVMRLIEDGHLIEETRGRHRGFRPSGLTDLSNLEVMSHHELLSLKAAVDRRLGVAA